MIEHSQVVIDELVVHHVGTRADGEPVRYSKSSMRLQDEEMVASVLKTYFFSAFKTEAYYAFIEAVEGAAGLVYQQVCAIFNDPSQFYPSSLQLAEFLQQQSLKPKIRGGEFYVALFRKIGRASCRERV